MNRAFYGLLSLAVTLSACGGCGDDDGTNNGVDATTQDARLPDSGPDDMTGPGPDTAAPDMTVMPGEVVEIDLAPYLGSDGAANGSRAYRLETDAPFSGPVIHGRSGDWIIENDVARFLVEDDNRVMSPCPWGGNVVDAAYLADGDDEDILGEICMFVNGGLTLKPDRIEVLADGSDGRAAVLAVSGDFVINDFLNLRAMVDDFVAGLGDRIHIDMNRILPVRLTVYYILRPGETNLHVLTAMRNDSDEQVDMLPIFLVASGGDGRYFNPVSATGGFGVGSSSVGVSFENLPFLAFTGETASYAYAPKPDPSLSAPVLPNAGAYLVISGVAAALLGVSSNTLLSILTLTEEQLATHEQVMHLAARSQTIIDHRLFVGNGSLGTMVDPILETNEVPTGTLRGIVRDTDGNPVPGARVSATRRGITTLNQVRADATGAFAMRVPPESYEVTARHDGMAPLGPVEVVVEADVDLTVEGVQVKLPSTIRVRVTTPDDGCTDPAVASPVAARLTVICEGDCPDAPTNKELDVGANSLPREFAAVIYGKNDGVLEAEVPPGDYRLVVDRGMEWSTWPSDAVTAGGILVSTTPGQTVEFDAEIARVLDTPNAYSGDFHVHSISSPDSIVPYDDRVRGFVAEGIDVIVSTDHDYVADFRPSIAALDAGDYMQSIVGQEVTTADLGHFNAFPLPYIAEHPRGGAFDWGNGDDYTHPPADLYRLLREHGTGERVIQLNHAEGLGLVKFAKADVLRGITYADRAEHRLPPLDPDPVTGDTGIWSDDFTAMELLNGNSRARWNTLGRWWMTMIGRGFTPTGTAVTDTHKLYSDLGAVPRTYVFGDTDVSCGDRSFADLTDYDGFVSEFVANTNAGRAIGTNGPFFTVTVTNGAGETASLGGTLSADDQTVATLDIQTPEWMQVDTIDVYLNPDIEDILTRPGERNSDPIPTTLTQSITWNPEDLATIHSGTSTHRAWRKSIQIPLSTSADAFVVFVVKGGESMWPVVKTAPFAFSNPVFLDADGNGYDNPPYAALAAQPPGPGDLPPCMDAFCGTRSPADPNRMTPKEILDVFRHADCEHGAEGIHRH